MKKIVVFILAVIAGVAILASLSAYWAYKINNSVNSGLTISDTQIQTNDTVRLGSAISLGSFLVDANGRTLYYFADDTFGKSSCVGKCLTVWSPFYAPSVVVSGGLNPADFNHAINVSGVNQTTYRGWPLYYFSGDKNSGDINGQGIQDLWFVAASPFYDVMVMNNYVSKIYLADVNGKALYYFKKDIAGTSTTNPTSNCTAQCLLTWKIFDEQQTIAPALLNSNDFKEFSRPDGQTQLSYKGRPLYIYSGDTKSGDTNGSGVGKLWYLTVP